MGLQLNEMRYEAVLTKTCLKLSTDGLNLIMLISLIVKVTIYIDVDKIRVYNYKT
ncbi:hypothetical protein [Metabacillus fastidiosus]|uniref:hypothetical protein n=1 Tax=Metabacillus fastidiosus TaxID=1458 RepID=UPI003D293F7F